MGVLLKLKHLFFGKIPMENKKQLTQLKNLTAKRNTLMEKVQAVDTQITSILDEIQTKKVVPKEDHPKPGSGPEKLCKAMSSRPKSKEVIAEKTGLTAGTVSLYLHQFNCFQSAGRGKGYVYLKPKKEKK